MSCPSTQQYSLDNNSHAWLKYYMGRVESRITIMPEIPRYIIYTYKYIYVFILYNENIL